MLSKKKKLRLTWLDGQSVSHDPEIHWLWVPGRMRLTVVARRARLPKLKKDGREVSSLRPFIYRNSH
jgi:hypothetical protein